MESHVQTIRQHSQELMKELQELLDFISENPEVSWEEEKACHALVTYLQKYNFEISTPFEGCPTGFLAEYSNGEGPRVVYLAKYNALPGFGPQGEDAHGCGHNWVAALAAGSAVLLSQLSQDFQGTVAVVGAPEASFYKPKVNILYSDYFRDTDAVFAAHLNDKNLLYSFPLPIKAYELTFHGERSQAFSHPDKGVNVIDCVLDALTEIRAIREGLTEFDRINYVITEGSSSVDFIPDYLKLRLAIGGTSEERLEKLSDNVLAIFNKTCQQYGAKLTVELCTTFKELVNLDSLHKLMEDCFKSFEEPYLVMPEVLGRTQLDIAPVSHLCPLQYMFFGVPDWISHQPTISRIAASHSPAAKEKLQVAMQIFSLAGLSVLTDKELQHQIAEEFTKKVNQNK